MMNYLIVKNLLTSDGVDYKGVDISKNLAGKQLYPPDKNEAWLVNTGDIPTHPDLVIVTESEYHAEKERIDKIPRPLTDSERLEELEQMMALMILGGGV